MYEQFFEAGLKSRFPSGLRETLPKPLAKAARKPQNLDSSQKRLDRLKKMVSESKTGKQTLDFLEQSGAKMVFEPMSYYGYFSPEENIIALNPKMSDEDLAVTFVHETRHAWQNTQMETWTPHMTPKAFLMTGYAIEADACATEVMYAYEMREKNPKIWHAHKNSPFGALSKQFEKTMNKTGDIQQAHAETFLPWYDMDSILRSYGDTYVEYISDVAKEAVKKKNKSVSETYFSQEITPKDISLNLLKDYDGTPFLQTKTETTLKTALQRSANLIETPEFLHISENQALRMTKALDFYMTKNRKGMQQLGLDKICVHKKDGKTSNCAAVLKNLRSEKNKSKAGSKSAIKATRQRQSAGR